MGLCHVRLSLEEDVSFLSLCITNATDNCVPSRFVRIRPRDKPGYNGHVRKLYRDCRRLHKAKQRSRDPLDIARFRAKRREAKIAFLESKNRFYSSLSSRLLDPATNSKDYWKLVKSVYGNRQHSGIPPLIDDGKIFTSDKDKADLLNDYFTSQTIPPNINTPLPPFSYFTDARLHDITINPTIVMEVLEKLNPNKASGPDDINNRILKECASTLCGPLSIIFNKSLK